MSDNYNIKIGVDGRSGASGVKVFSSALSDALKVLREFDRRSKSAFEQLNKLANVNLSSLSKTVRGTAQAIETLNRVKINKQLINNLQMLQQTLARFRFNADALKRVPEAMQALSRMKIDTRFVGVLNEVKAALRGFRGPPAGVEKWRSILASLAKISVSSALGPRIAAIGKAFVGFKGPSASALKIPAFLKQIGASRLSPALVKNLVGLRTALSGFAGPSAASVNNLARLITVMNTAKPGQISAIAASIRQLNGLTLKVGASAAATGARGTTAFAAMQRGILGTTFAMRALDRQMSLTYHATNLLSATMGSITVGAVITGIYETGNAFLSLQRTLGAVAASTTETQEHMQFLRNLTTELPVSLDAAAKSYGKFAVAARLSGTSVADTQKVYTGFATALSAMGVAPDNQKYAFLALEQMFSKGTIQMEELRVQLGDHIPGVVPMLAEAMNVSTAKLLQMVEAGEVGADVLIKLADVMQQRFGPAIEAAMNSSSAQITGLRNAWDEFKRIIFDSGFNAGLGTMAKTLADALRTDGMKKFAADFGRSMGEVFKVIGVVGKALMDNRDTIISFLKAFAGYSVVIAAGKVIRLFLVPLTLLMGALRVARVGMLGLAGAMGVMGGAKAVAGITAMSNAIGLLVRRLIAIPAAVAVALAAVDTLFNDGEYTKKTVAFVADITGQIYKALEGGVGNFLTNPAIAGALSGLDEDLRKADEQFKKIQESDLTAAQNIEKNAALQEKLARNKAVELSKAAQEVWDELNAVGKANQEYRTQLKLLDEIAKKRGLSDDQKKAWADMLAAQMLDDRDPVGAMVRDYREELASAKAKTGEQRALNYALEDQNDLLKQGIRLTDAQVDVLRQYHLGIAKMNGEVGNGIERWTAKVGDWNDRMQEAISSGIGGLSDELANFLTGAEADFAGLARSILKTFVQISLESLMKDLFTSMGMNGEANGKNQAEQALEKLANIGGEITTAMTNVYTNGLSVNGVPLTDTGKGFLGSPELPGQRGVNAADRITRAPLAEITDGAGPVQRTFRSPVTGEATYPVTPGSMREKMLRDYSAQHQPIRLTDDAWSRKMELTAVEAAKAGQVTGLRGTISDQVGRQLMPFVPPQETPAGVDAIHTSGLNFAKPTNNDDFVNQMYARARASGLADPQARLMASQAALESGWGKSGLTRRANNYFGMKAGSSWKGPVEVMSTKEQRSDGSWYTENARFRKYDSMEASILDKEAQMKRLWPSSQNASTFEEAASELRNGKYGAYATDLNYESKLASINRRIDPNNTYMQQMQAGSTGGIDPTTTGSIDMLNQKLGTLGTTAQQTAAPMDQMKTKLTETGTSAQMAGQQTQMANQTKTMAEQQYAMQTQATGVQVQTAGMNASMAGPQFQQAGTSIMSAGQQAAMAGSTAQTAQAGLGQFGNGISGLLGPLASAIPGLGQFGGMIMQLVQQMMMGGGGGGLFGAFSEGGYSDSPVTRVRAGAGMFANAPHFSEGTANTSGIPAILHDNEAVIPLSRGRKVPVEMPEADEPMYGAGAGGSRGGRAAQHYHFHGVKDADSFRNSKQQIASQISSAQRRAEMRQG